MAYTRRTDRTREQHASVACIGMLLYEVDLGVYMCLSGQARA
jgi:hypothetical protein